MGSINSPLFNKFNHISQIKQRYKSKQIPFYMSSSLQSGYVATFSSLQSGYLVIFVKLTKWLRCYLFQAYKVVTLLPFSSSQSCYVVTFYKFTKWLCCYPFQAYKVVTLLPFSSLQCGDVVTFFSFYNLHEFKITNKVAAIMIQICVFIFQFVLIFLQYRQVYIIYNTISTFYLNQCLTKVIRATTGTNCDCIIIYGTLWLGGLLGFFLVNAISFSCLFPRICVLPVDYTTTGRICSCET